MATTKQYDHEYAQEDFARMEFLAYFILLFTAIGAISVIFLLYNWLTG